MLGILQHVVDGSYLFFHEVTQHLRVGIEVIGDDSCRGMTAVSRTESIVNIYIGIRGQLLGKVFLLSLHLFLCLIVSGVGLINAHGFALFFGVEA